MSLEARRSVPGLVKVEGPAGRGVSHADAPPGEDMGQSILRDRDVPHTDGSSLALRVSSRQSLTFGRAQPCGRAGGEPKGFCLADAPRWSHEASE